MANYKSRNRKNAFGISQDDPHYYIKNYYASLHTAVPKYKEMPRLSDFGLPENAKDIIYENQIAREKKAKTIGWIVYFISLAICVYLLYKITAGQYGFGFWVFFIAIFLGGLVLGCAENAAGKKPKEIAQIAERYHQYELAVKAYNYWQCMESVNYWNQLNGYQFEQEVASLFRKKGYDATVTKGSGDGGVDVILTKYNERIAVQCKAHSNPVGPAVIRDLYGTMTSGGYTKAILVSKSGFTKGVYEFAEGKPIELMSLDNILAMVRKQ